MKKVVKPKQENLIVEDYDDSQLETDLCDKSLHPGYSQSLKVDNSSTSTKTLTEEDASLSTTKVTYSIENESHDTKKVVNYSVYMDMMSTDLKKFVFFKCPENLTVNCRITRNNRGIERIINPEYYIHYELSEKKVFLLAARRKKIGRSLHYIISMNANDFDKNTYNYVAKLKSVNNANEYVLQENLSLKRFEKKHRELALVLNHSKYGYNGPRILKVILRSENNLTRHNEENLVFCYKSRKMDNLIELQNKPPIWHDSSKSFGLHFDGRVTHASAKNFQIVHSISDEKILMQFGKMGDQVFTCDFTYPFSVIEAFAVALTSFEF